MPGATVWILAMCAMAGLCAAGQGDRNQEAPSEPPAEQPSAAMTFNIRYDNPDDGENRWDKRRGFVVKAIAAQDAQLLGVQEALKHQLDYLLEKLPRYKRVGVGRDDGKDAGEFSAILYDPLRFECADSETFWLSDTPDVPGSKSWGNGVARICTWARLRDRGTGRVLLVYNTHLDNVSRESRVKGLELIVRRAGEEMQIAANEGGRVERSAQSDRTPAKPQAAVGLIIMGDFNAGESSEEVGTILTNEIIDLTEYLISGVGAG